jgi:hypothetical protein
MLSEFGDFLILNGSTELVKAYRNLSTDQRRVLVDLAQVMAASRGQVALCQARTGMSQLAPDRDVRSH